MKAKINKLFLFTCGAGEVERIRSKCGGLASSPPPSRLFVTERRPERRALACGFGGGSGDTGATPGADDSQTQDVCDLSTAHCEGRRSRCGLLEKRAKALRAPGFPSPGGLCTPAPR